MRRLITITGADRPGLIAAVSRVLAAAGADLEDISMSRLSGNFAMIVVARDGDEAAIRRGLEEQAGSLGLYTHIEPAAHEAAVEANAYVSAVGPNRVGIVAALAETLAAHDANILEMITQLLVKTEAPVYMVRMEAHVPGDIVALEKDLQDAAERVGVEVRLEPLERADF